VKNFISRISNALGFLYIVCIVASVVAFAQEAVVAPEGADTIAAILTFLAGIPKVGAILVAFLKYFGLIAAGLTLVTGILKFVNVCLKFFAKPEINVINKIVSIIEVVIRYVGFFSTFNIQKKKV